MTAASSGGSWASSASSAGLARRRPAAAGALAERYCDIAPLGSGGMGDVYLSLSRGIGGFVKLVVVKKLKPCLARNPEFLEMFLKEARLAARLNHPNVVQTNEVGCDQDGRYFIAMEYLEGQPYSRVLKRLAGLSERLPLALELHVLCEVLEGLHYAHELRDFDGTPLELVHRDLSPQNVFLTYSGECKLLDFGIAKDRLSDVETDAGVFKGKISFIPPEQVHGGAIDRRTDLFAAGAMLWRALAGAPLWSGRPATQIFRALAAGEIPDLCSLAPDTDPELARICMRALAPRKEDRYGSALEMRWDLEAFMAAHGIERSRAPLGEFVAGLFAAERDELRHKTQACLRELETETGADPRAAPTSLYPAVLPAAPRELRHTRPSRRWLVAGVAVVSLLIAGLPLVRRAAMQAPAASPTSPPGPADFVAIDIAADPPDARIRVDGVARPNPWTARLPRSARTLLVTAERDGYLSKTRRVELKADVVLDLDLASSGLATSVPLGAAPAPASTARPGPALPATPAAQRPDAPAGELDAGAPAEPAPCAEPWRVGSNGVKKLRPECKADVVSGPTSEDACAYPWQVDERGVKRLRSGCAQALR